LIAFAVVGVLAAPACGVNDRLNDARGRGDAPVAKVDSSAKEVIEMPDRFSNVAHACDGHGHRVFVTTQTDSGRELEVINDSSCK
jgi:hypothetical protein